MHVVKEMSIAFSAVIYFMHGNAQSAVYDERMAGRVKAAFGRFFTLDNFVGQLLWLGLITVASAVAGSLLDLPVVTLAGLAFGVLYLSLAGILAWREGWRPGTMRGARGWTADVIWGKEFGENLLLHLTPPNGMPVKPMLCEIWGPRNYKKAYSHEQVRPPGATAHNGVPNPHYFVVHETGVMADGYWQVRWWISDGLGLTPVASQRFRIKRGKLI